ncbi:MULTISPECIES: DUF6458 family protein [Actinomadura]|uniref:DUF6458 domain-containing protein n=1 Tax=Actinomadura madurae TaxID=1993 RepID=A0A1I5WWN2_9ACTN|nr:DUF6458 family protein [Actinomadura madurae]SFQ24100.1 hypothetical protein SAMN04489713_1254 [Actinomadura madurae]SPT60688.1 Uncharacterised protein [Actinomadura madurae]
MGIGVSLAFIALGAILAFAIRVDLSGLDIHMVGWILILVGLVSMGFTVKYTRPRRRAGRVVGADPAYGDEPGTVIREEHIIEDPPPLNRPSERVERVIEHPVDEAAPHGHVAQDPAYSQDPAHAQNPAEENSPSVVDSGDRISQRRRWRRTARR